jgi:hypothetical protein
MVGEQQFVNAPLRSTRESDSYFKTKARSFNEKTFIHIPACPDRGPRIRGKREDERSGIS